MGEGARGEDGDDHVRRWLCGRRRKVYRGDYGRGRLV
jgi:hypothetical protein